MHIVKAQQEKGKKNGTQTGRIVLTINMVNIYFTERSLCSEGKFIMLLCFQSQGLWAYSDNFKI